MEYLLSGRIGDTVSFGRMLGGLSRGRHGSLIVISLNVHTLMFRLEFAFLMFL
jgi:hypothetical protein